MLPSIFTVSGRMLRGGSQRLNATSSILRIASSKFLIPTVYPELLTPIINCPPSVFAKQTIDLARVSLSGKISLNSVCKSSPFSILS
jgi:hypothetical protein